MFNKNLTQEELQNLVNHAVTSARDSVKVINNEIQKKNTLGQLNKRSISNIERNVAHLEVVMADPNVVSLGGDLSDLTAAITNGKAALA